MPFSHSVTPHRRESCTLRMCDHDGVTRCGAARRALFRHASNLPRQCQDPTSAVVSRRSKVQHAELFSWRHGLVQDIRSTAVARHPLETGSDNQNRRHRQGKNNARAMGESGAGAATENPASMEYAGPGIRVSGTSRARAGDQAIRGSDAPTSDRARIHNHAGQEAARKAASQGPQARSLELGSGEV